MADHPTFGQVDYVAGHTTAASFDISKVGEAGDLPAAPFKSLVEDFYMTNPIARASVVMAECSALHAKPAPDGGGVRHDLLGDHLSAGP